jgi:hypothetical protein
MSFSFFCPIFLRHPSEGRCSQGERLHSGRDPKNHREEPGKQKTRSRGAQEFARSRAQEKERQKKRVPTEPSDIGERREGIRSAMTRGAGLHLCA